MISESVIIAIISAISGGGITGLITFGATRKKASAEADSVVINQWKDIYANFKEQHEREIARIQTQYNAAYAKLEEKESNLQSRIDYYEGKIEEKEKIIDECYNEIQKHRDEKSEVKEKLTNALVKIEKLEIMKCEVRGCKNRKPPSDLMM